MYLQNHNVELTKVHYYDVDQSGRNVQISTISRNEPHRSYLSKNTVIKKNIFGHKWVLKINESKDLKKPKTKLVIYILVFVCLLTAVCFGIVLSVESKFFKNKSPSKHSSQVPTLNSSYSIQRENFTKSDTTDRKVKENIKLESQVQDETTKNLTRPNNSLCLDCRHHEEICLKIIENEKPKCIKILDAKDPTGCGGLCKINKEYCKLLDPNESLFQCRGLHTKLKCPEKFFNCGNRCISNAWRCDGIFQCSDQSDEKNCDCDLKTHFQCGNLTGCLEKQKKCDGKVDCWDDSDEINCNRVCNQEQIPCHNGQCIHKENFCDGIFHCPDQSDEPKGCKLRK